MVWVVGLTGGIGSGKSTVTQLFAELGAPIIDTDIFARELVQANLPAYTEILKRYGQSILNPDKELNRRKLREIIFSNPVERLWLEGLLHPLIEKRLEIEIKKVSYPYCIVVIPLLTEQFQTYQPILSHVLVVETTHERQLQFSIARDKASIEDIQKIISVQATREQRRQIADTLLLNDGHIAALKDKVALLHRQFLEMATPNTL